MTDINLGDRSAIITGAGQGLGRSHALELARHGALVCVNDLNQEAVDAVVQEIKDAGGTAIGYAGSVADYETMVAMVEYVIDKFGYLDILVNNAGIIRDGAFHKMPVENIDLVLDVHLLGSAYLCHAAWPHLRGRPAARIINTSSDSGLFGNFGQVNYGAAKMGLVGMTKALADEGRIKGVCVNAIVPVALTEMTEKLFAEAGFTDDDLGPQWVSPVVAYLASAECELTGRAIGAAGGYIGEIFVAQNAGAMVHEISELTPEKVHDLLGLITDRTGVWEPVNMNAKISGTGNPDDDGMDTLFAKFLSSREVSA